MSADAALPALLKRLPWLSAGAALAVDPGIAEAIQPVRTRPPRACTTCRRPGHYARTCPLRPVETDLVDLVAPPTLGEAELRPAADNKSSVADVAEPQPMDAGPRRRRCSICSVLGHRATTCSQRPPASRPVRLSVLQARPVANDVDPFARPRTRGDCAGGMRPCPWVSCRHHLWMSVGVSGKILQNHPGVEPEDMAISCSLDVADEGGKTLEDVGLAMGLTRERIRQIEMMGMENAAIAIAQRGGIEAPIDRQHTPLGAAMGNE